MTCDTHAETVAEEEPLSDPKKHRLPGRQAPKDHWQGRLLDHGYTCH